MSTENDQFSEPDYVLLPKLKNILAYSSKASVMESTGITEEDNTAFGLLLSPYETAVSKMNNINTITLVMYQTRDLVREPVVAFARKFVLKWYYNNLLASTTDIMNASLKTYSDARVNHQGGTIDIPILVVDSVSGQRFGIKVMDKTGSEAKPQNIVFIRIRYFVKTPEATPPTAPSDYCKLRDFSKHPIMLLLPVEYAGLPINIAACYVDAQGNEGGFSAVVGTHVT